MNSLVRLTILSLCLLVVSACSYEQQYIRHDQIQARARYVAILPMVNLSSYPHAGRVVGDILTTELYARSGFQIMEPSMIISELSNEDLEIKDVLDKTQVRDAAKQLGVDTIIYGSVSEFKYKRGLNEDPVVGINLRMLDVNTGQVLWSGSKSKTGGCFWFCEDSLNRLAQEICGDLVSAMVSD